MKARRFLRKNKGNIGVGVALALLVALVVVGIGGNGSQPQSEAAVAPERCGELANLWDNLQAELSSEDGDALGCFLQTFGLGPQDGDVVRVSFVYNNGWSPIGSAMSSTETTYAASSAVTGTHAFEVRVFNEASEDILYRANLDRDAAFGLLDVHLYNLPGADIVEIEDTVSGTQTFEVI